MYERIKKISDKEFQVGWYLNQEKVAVIAHTLLPLDFERRRELISFAGTIITETAATSSAKSMIRTSVQGKEDKAPYRQ
jgi:hypothetical protein